MSLPDPLAPPDLEVRGCDYMPLLGARLFGSEFYTLALKNPRGGWAGQKLWWEAFQQKPAGSLPANEHSLCRLADFGTDTRAWNRARVVAMHGFVLCSDGRYYHPVIVELATKAAEVRAKARDKKARQRADRAADERQDAAPGRHDDAARRKHDENPVGDAQGQTIDNIDQGPDCPQGRPGSVPVEGKGREGKEEGLRPSPAAKASVGTADMFEEPHSKPKASSRPKRATGTKPNPVVALRDEGVAVLADLTGKRREELFPIVQLWIRDAGRGEAAAEAVLGFIRRAHTERIAPCYGWIRDQVQRHAARELAASEPVPEVAGGYRTADVVEHCNTLSGACLDGMWRDFSSVVADALNRGADPDAHIYPVMRGVAGQIGSRVHSAGFFVSAFRNAMERKAAA